MTHPTKGIKINKNKAIYKLILSDFVRVSNVGSLSDMLFNEQDLTNSLEKIEIMDYHQEKK